MIEFYYDYDCGLTFSVYTVSVNWLGKKGWTNVAHSIGQQDIRRFVKSASGSGLKKKEGLKKKPRELNEMDIIKFICEFVEHPNIP